MWFTILLLLDAFVLGGLVVWRLMLNVLESAMAQATNPDAIGTYFHVDNLFVPYWVSHTGIMLLLVVITAGAFVWLKIRPRPV